jgi:hypothetical protein
MSIDNHDKINSLLFTAALILALFGLWIAIKIATACK